ncbi:hypothetical protein JCM17961_21220 [Endothiovibrio diazotrophicus]
MSKGVSDPVSAAPDIDKPKSYAAPRKALVIGIRKYDVLNELQSGRLDAVSFGKKLESLGFSVTSSIDENADTIWKRISQFESSLNPGDVALFYYSGHGFQYDGLNYMTARDTPKPIPVDDLLYVTVPLDNIVSRLRRRKPGFSLILIDACRENTSEIKYPDGTAKAVGNGGYSSVQTPPPNMIMGFATYFGKTAQSSTDPNENSTYTRYLNRYIDREDTDILDILVRYVGPDVHAAQPGQVPETRSLPSGYFFPRPGAFADALEENTWNKALADKYRGVETFLWHWPVGRYAAQARAWLTDNKKRKDAENMRAGVDLSVNIVAGAVDHSAFVSRVDSRGLNLNGSFVRPSDMASRNAFTNLARVERNFLAYTKPDAHSMPVGSISPGQLVRVVNLPALDSNGPASNFTEVEINPDSKYSKKVFIKDAFEREQFWNYPFWVSIELKPMNDEDVIRDNVRVAAIAHQTIGKSGLDTLEIKNDLSLGEVVPYIESIYKSSESVALPDMRLAFSKVVLSQPAGEGRGENTLNALLYLRNLQVSSYLNKIGIKRENIVINEVVSRNEGEDEASQNPLDRIQIFFPRVY